MKYGVASSLAAALLNGLSEQPANDFAIIRERLATHVHVAHMSLVHKLLNLAVHALSELLERFRNANLVWRHGFKCSHRVGEP
jgi:hypothetical protein